MKGCLLFPNVSGIFIFKGEQSPQYDCICSHCVLKNSLSIWRTLIPRFLSVTLLLHDWENMWNKTSYYSCILLFEESELTKADRTVGVNCNIFFSISSGTA